jgi:hypothetical protein
VTTDEQLRLLDVLNRCACKLKAEYDRQQPDAGPRECWAEAEAAFALLAEYLDAENDAVGALFGHRRGR